MTVTAISSDFAHSTAEGAAGGVVSIAILLPNADIQGGSTAYIGDGAQINAGSLTVTATATPDALAWSRIINLGGITGDGVTPTTSVTGTTEAYVGANANVQLGGGAATVTASRTPKVESKAEGLSVSAIGVTLQFVSASTGGTVGAHIGDATILNAGSLSLTATDTSAPKASAFGVQVSIGSVAGITTSATDNTSVIVYVGPADPSFNGGGTSSSPAKITTTGVAGVSAVATSNSNPFAKADLVGVGLAVSAGVSISTTTSSPTVRSYLGTNAQVDAGTATVALRAIYNGSAIVSGTGFGVSLGFAAGVVKTTANLTPTVQVGSAGGGSMTGGTVVFNARVNTTEAGAPQLATFDDGDGPPKSVAPAYGTAKLGALGLAAGVAGALVTVKSNPTAGVTVRSGTQLSATGAVKVLTQVYAPADSDGKSLAGGFLAGIGLVESDTTAGGTIATVFDGSVTSAASVTVASTVLKNAQGDGRANAGALGLGVTAASLDVTSSGSITTAVGGSIAAAGAITVESNVQSSAVATYRGFVIAVVAFAIENIHATDSTATSTTVAGSLTSTSGKIAVNAFHNFDGSAFIANTTEAVASVGVAGAIAMGTSNLFATAQAVTTATVASTATLATGGAVQVWSVSANNAIAQMKNTSGGLVNLGSIDSNPTATVNGNTSAHLLGNVRRQVNGIDTSGALSIDVRAEAEDFATGTMTNIGGGVLSISNSNSTATGNPVVAIEIGSSQKVIIATNDITAKAFAHADSDSSTSSDSGGALNVNLFTANASLTPTARATVGGGSTITSDHGSVTVNATVNELPAPSSDGTFTASTDVSDGANQITFAKPHNAVSGQAVVYHSNGQTEVVGLDDGLTYSLIVTANSPKSIQLGATFSSGDVNPTLDLFDFGNRPHNLHTGDIVFYSYDTVNDTGVAGLVNGGQYQVYVVDDFKFKLQPVGFTSKQVSVSGSAVGNGPDQINVANTFSDGDLVTYHAPVALATFTTGQVNKRWNGSAWVAATNNVYFAIDATPNDDGNNDFLDIGLADGERVYYTASDPSRAIGGLANGQFYYVHRIDGQSYQFANSYCEARGYAADNGCVDGNSDPINRNVIALAPGGTAADAAVLHSVRRDENAPISGLVDNGSYHVVGCAGACSDNGYFKLSLTPGGGPIDIDNLGQNGSGHLFRTEGIPLSSSGTGRSHKLVIDIAPGVGTQKFDGIGGAGFGAVGGDSIVSASATGAGGGAINVAIATSNASLKVTVSNTVGADAHISAGTDVNITTDGYAFAKAVASNDGGGFISVGKAAGDMKLAIDNQLNVLTNAILTANRNVTVRSHSDLEPTVTVSGTQGGLGAGSLLSVSAALDYLTETKFDGDIEAGGNAVVEAATELGGLIDVTSNVGGFGADGRATANVSVGSGSSLMSPSAFTHVVLQDDADIGGRNVTVTATVSRMQLTVKTYTRAIAFGANSEATSNLYVHGSSEMTLDNGANVIGNVATKLQGLYEHKNLYAYSRAICRCFGGSTRPTSLIDDDSDARVVGGFGSTIQTSDLTVVANQEVDGYNREASRSGGFLDFGGASDDNGSPNMHRRIFWEARVIMLGEPNPWLVVDSSGRITKLVNVCGHDDAGNYFCDNPFTGQHDTPDLGGTTITVDDIIYDHGANARFLGNDPGSLDGRDTPDSEIWGRRGVFEFQQTWDHVKLFNSSNLNLVINTIDVVNTLNSPLIEVRVDKIYDDGAPTSYASSDTLPLPSLGSTFDFDIEYTFPPTDVLIENLCSLVGCPNQPYIRLGDGPGGFGGAPADYIENPIGNTYIENLSGDILSGPNAEIIRTNIIEILAPHGNIGYQSPTHANPDPVRNPIAVEIVRWQDVLGTYHDIVVKVDAGGDAVLDLTANRRTDEALGSPFAITVDHINAGNDVDLVLNDSKNGNDVADNILVTVNLYNPGTTLYRYVFPGPYTPAPSDSGPLAPCPAGNCGSGSGKYETHFRPDVNDPNLDRILRAFGVLTTKLDSTYTFTDVRAGDDIDICHVTTGGEEPKTCATTAVNDATHAVTADTPTTKLHITANTDVDWTLATPPTEVDDPGIAIDLPQIFIRTNGNIIDTERIGDLLAGHIHSTEGDVTLTSPMRILDANRMPTIDVTGANITMTAGTLGGIGGIGTPSLPNPNSPNPADAGNLGGFLEINTAVQGTGVLMAFDTASADAETKGIYLDELTGDMPVHIVTTAGTAGDLTTGNVSLRTVNGSIVDAKHVVGTETDDAEVLGQTIDIDANGGSIGTFGNDLEIDSTRDSNPPCSNLMYLGTAPGCADTTLLDSDAGLAAANDDVGLEATASIYLTEVASYLRLVLAHAVTGDIRITVRDSVALDEDLFLIKNGSAQFAESNSRAPSGNDVDAVRVVPNGTIHAETGNVKLRVGDNVATHQNSQIVAHQNIDVYGDFHFAVPDPDPGYGTNMVLRGKIVADAIVTPGPDSRRSGRHLHAVVRCPSGGDDPGIRQQ